MVWYDELYYKIGAFEVLNALDSLGGKGTIGDVERKIIELYELSPKAISKSNVRRPLHTLARMDVLSFDRTTCIYHVKRRLGEKLGNERG